MSKELAFTDDNDVVKYLDTTTSLNLALTADGLAFDLTNAKTIVIKIANDDGYIMQEAIDLTTVTSPLGGTLSFPINKDIMNTLVPDDYDIEVWVTMNDGTQAIFPSDGTLGFSIEENLMSDTGEVIPTITLNDFKQQFDDLSSQMENAVHNVQKGDQGNPGNGIKAANNQYQLSDSPVTVPTGGWSDTILATTDQLPYLWTKIIFTYDDGTTKEINFVSSRGDTGGQGPIGPVGPQGKQGNGLVVRGKADKEENLPTTGNNQGDGYLVGTDLYIWIDGSWQNMGSITPDLADYVKVADMNNALNAKQDKIGYTPADDSKVVHTADMRKPSNDVVGLEDVSTSVYQNQLVKGTDIHTVTKDGIYPLGFSYVNFVDSYSHWGTLQVINNNAIITHIARIENGIWIETQSGSPESWNDWYKLADDSKVAHLSGANNFDTTPTVNNNPLLLASSLPADLARTSQLANFTDGLQKSGKDVATTADVTSAVNSATANVVTTNKLANFTAGLQSGGVTVATSDDLKSVENSAWRQLKNVPLGGTFLYRIDQSSKSIYISYSLGSNFIIGNGTTIADFSSIVNNIETISGRCCQYNPTSDSFSTDIALSISSPANITVASGSSSTLGGSSFHTSITDGAYFTYDSLK
ncbi:hypothetical protein OF387_15160 [Lentilactobacillus hilgardii]|nr:hypothetical protein [Lentilactobacillus hilgardii]MCV3742572.1 hypothetical protein [Lentilactobacillus hilgardii]